jgi:hypothetical protein
MELVRIASICLVTILISCNFGKSPHSLLSLPTGIEISELKQTYLASNVSCDTIYENFENTPIKLIRFFPVDIAGVSGVLVVYTNDGKSTTSRYEWHMDSTASWLYTLRNNPSLQRHAKVDDYSKIKALISSELKHPGETTDTSICFAIDSLLLLYSPFSHSIIMSKPSNKFVSDDRALWLFSAPLEENFLTALRIGQSRKEIEIFSILEDTLIYLGTKQLKLERMFCNVWGIPSEVVFHFDSNQHLDYAAWRHIFDYRNLINGDFFLSDLKRTLGKPMKTHKHSLFWKFGDSKIIFDISLSQEVSYELASDSFLEFIKL